MIPRPPIAPLTGKGRGFFRRRRERRAGARGAFAGAGPCAPVIAEVLSSAETFDAHSVMSIDPSAKQIRRMIARALDEANVTPGEIDYINTHGTATEQNDEIEARTIEAVFRNAAIDKCNKVPYRPYHRRGGRHRDRDNGAQHCAENHPRLQNLEEPVRPLNS